MITKEFLVNDLDQGFLAAYTSLSSYPCENRIVGHGEEPNIAGKVIMKLTFDNYKDLSMFMMRWLK